METSGRLTSKESFAILHEIENMKYLTGCGIKYSDWREQNDRRRYEAIKNLVPEVGLGCTICYYSDKRMKFFLSLKGHLKYSLNVETDIG